MGWPLNLNQSSKMRTTFVLYVLTNYALEKRYSRPNVVKRQKWREFFPYIFSSPRELCGITTQVISKVSSGIYEDCSILFKNVKTLALIVTEEMRGQERPLKSD